MRRLQIYIEEELDAALQRQARREKTSKAALIRKFVRERIKPLPANQRDPILGMAGADDYRPEPVDDVVYR